MSALPSAGKADDLEIPFFIERNGLSGSGLGFVDVHLLAACKMGGCRLWTADPRLRAAAAALGIAFD